MSKITELVIKYKQTKDQKVFEALLKLIKRDIEKRVEIIYRKLKFYQIDKTDIKQELYIKILKIIDNYDIREPFENYLFSSLKYWQPKLIKDDFIHFESLYNIDERTGEELEIDIEDKKQTNIDSNLSLEIIFKECKTETEKLICKMYLENPKITEEEIGSALKMTRQNISLILKKLRKRLKKYLTK